MMPAYRVTALQLCTFVAASVIVGAAGALIATHLMPEPAGAAVIHIAEQKDNSAPANRNEKKKKGRPVVHFEIGCRDSAKTGDFYSKLFDWQINVAGPASVIQTGAGKGIDGHITSLGHEPQNYVTFYVEVDDIQAYLDKATALGGKVLVPPIAIPTGHFAWLADPDGNIVGLIQQKKR
jgi:predicted enzyme related to lactoylglutathione lyase